MKTTQDVLEFMVKRFIDEIGVKAMIYSVD